MKRGLIDVRLERTPCSEEKGEGDLEMMDANPSSDEEGVVGKSESFELGLEPGLGGWSRWGKSREMLSVKVRRNESGEEERAAMYADEVGGKWENGEGGFGGDGAERGGMRRLSSIENSYADNLASPIL